MRIGENRVPGKKPVGAAVIGIEIVCLHPSKGLDLICDVMSPVTSAKNHVLEREKKNCVVILSKFTL